jgi:putative salt-induced outer membrane protein YdiY
MTKILNRPSSLACALLIVAATALSTRAAETADTNKWVSSVAAGMTLTSGTKDTLLAAINVATAKKAPHYEIKLGAGGAYGETDNEKTSANAMGYGQYNYLFTERFYAGIRLDALHDSIVDIDYRFTLSPLVGYYLIKNTNAQFFVEAGPSLVVEQQGGEQDTYAGLRLAERYERKLSDVAKVWESVEFIPQVDDFENYILTMEVGVEAALNKALALRVVFRDLYDNVPAEGAEKNEIQFIASVVYKF